MLQKMTFFSWLFGQPIRKMGLAETAKVFVSFQSYVHTAPAPRVDKSGNTGLAFRCRWWICIISTYDNDIYALNLVTSYNNNSNGGRHACVLAIAATEFVRSSATKSSALDLAQAAGFYLCLLHFWCISSRVITPHADLACILQFFESVSVVSYVRRYF